MNMRNIVICIFAVLVMFNLAFGQTPPPGSTEELTGIVSDATCQGRHNRKAVTNYGCTRKCVEDGADYALVVGHRVYILEGHRADLDKFAGGRATVSGRVTENRVVVDSVTAVKRKANLRNRGGGMTLYGTRRSAVKLDKVEPRWRCSAGRAT